jgi:hypothetical protein
MKELFPALNCPRIATSNKGVPCRTFSSKKTGLQFRRSMEMIWYRCAAGGLPNKQIGLPAVITEQESVSNLARFYFPIMPSKTSSQKLRRAMGSPCRRLYCKGNYLVPTGAIMAKLHQPSYMVPYIRTYHYNTILYKAKYHSLCQEQKLGYHHSECTLLQVPETMIKWRYP